MNHSKLKLSFLLLISLLPIVLATLYFRQSMQEGAATTTNKGVLISPLLELSRLDLRDKDGNPAYLPFDELVAGVDPEVYEPRPWQLLFLSSANCAEVCLERLYFLRQIHARLGRESDRVQRAFVLVDTETNVLPQTTSAVLEREHPDLKRLSGNATWLQQQLAPSAQGRDPVQEHFIYVADPVGNIMLYFTPENTPEQILDDIDKLLDQSSLG